MSVVKLICVFGMYWSRCVLFRISAQRFGQTHSAIGQMRAHLTNCVRIWSLLVGLTKCAAHLGKRAAQLAKCTRNWSTARAFARAIYQTLRIWSNSARLTNWSNALRICPNAQIGQMRLTVVV